MAPESLSDVSMLSCLPQLFSDHEPTRSPSPQFSQSDNTPELSLPGTSAPLLTQPSLTDYLSNFSSWPNQAKDSNAPLSRPSSPPMDTAPAVLPPPPTAHSIKRGRRRPRKKTRITRQRKAGQNSVYSVGTKTGHSDGISKQVPTEAQMASQIQV